MAGEIKPKPQVDQVDVAMDIGVDLPNSFIVMVFNKPLSKLSFSPEEAIEVGKTLISGAEMLIAKKV